MPSITAIREQRTAKVAEARALLSSAERENRSLTDTEQSKFDTLKTDITALEAAEQRQQFVDDAERRQTGVVVNRNGDTTADLEQRVSLLTVLRAGMEGRALTGAEAEVHAELERRHGAPKHGGILVPLSAFERRANTTGSAGGLVGTDHRADMFIGPLRNSLLVRSLGVRTLSGLTGNVSIPKAGAGLTVGWVTEGQPLPESDMDFESVTLTPHHVGGITELSRQLIQQSSPAVEDLARDDLSFAIAQAVDRAIIAGTGANGQPLGIINRDDVQTADLPATWADVLAIEQQLAALNVIPTGWYTSPGVLTNLRGILKAASAGSDYIATAKTIGELPVASSNAAPADTAILGDWTQVLLGQWGAVELLVNPYAEAPYRRGGVLVRAFATVDVAVRHEQAFVVATEGTP
ncbi:phage major capsid protein [Pseudoxanthomonas winnipegensis]|uniref:Phage major capsid protein n=1 Tax=Pseudoxanthomonas winnipegensis TaxID=2480810 RepID=A0A4Q8LEA3_9GAMM|nr:phage major capsid protein [Pseudoxanthomonas winnipegensis]RZZ88922.1 phage major capsid protein [Pseudoxanthomonas winnipegensis]TAA27369.1 phage major capsid protein [Pseudoxanthomonas winnipegensis]TBV75655.1 phage major capsid protein [Pseudoxanthomonas winnipegensis]